MINKHSIIAAAEAAGGFLALSLVTFLADQVNKGAVPIPPVYVALVAAVMTWLASMLRTFVASHGWPWSNNTTQPPVTPATTSTPPPPAPPAHP